MNGAKILLIDYDPASIRRTTTPLIKAGYEVEVAKDGISGLTAFDQLQPDLVLVEAMLPRKHGFEVCQEIKNREQGKNTPVLITTAVCRGRKYRTDALQIYGCDEYIEKPIADEELLAMIAKFVELAHQRADEHVRQQLSEAIDAATPTAAVPVAEEPGDSKAIEAMSDDEIEARIDAMLLGCTEQPEDPVETLQPPAAEAPTEAPVEASFEPTALPSDAVAPSPSQPREEQTTAVATPVEDAPAEPPETAVDDEMERRVAAMVEAQPAPAPEPVAAQSVPEPAPAPVKAPEPVEAPAPPAPKASAPAAPVEQAQPELEEWTETAPAAKGKKTPLVAAAAIVVLLAAGGTVAYLQGWIGGTGRGSAANGAETASLAPSPAVEPSPVEPEADDPMDPTREELDTIAADAAVIHEPQDGSEGSGPSDSDDATATASVVPAGPDPDRVAAARREQAAAERQLNRAAGTMRSSLLTDAVAGSDEPEIPTAVPDDIEVDANELIAGAVPPPVQRGDLVDISTVDRRPVPIEFEQPVYDELARRKRQQGTVVLEVLIDENGKVIDTRLLQEIPRSRLNDAAVRAVSRWTFEPAIKNGKAVRVWKREEIIFRL